jgi:hypothetical protein
MTGLEILAHQFKCPECGAEPGALCVDVKPVLHLARYDVGRAAVVAEHGPQSKPGECPRCAQTSDTGDVCQPCRRLERQPQGETVRLFEPAPNQLPGQCRFPSR